MKATNAKFILPLDFPQAMDLEDPTDARFVNVADMKHWELAPTNPATFEKAGINFALTANGLKDASSFLPNLRKAIQYGLSEQKALDALTSTPASLLGVSDLVGSLDAGKLANFVITNGPVFADKTTIIENWVQGEAYPIAKEQWSSLAGKYDLQLGANKATLSISGEPGGYKVQILAKDTTSVDFSQKESLINISFSWKADKGKRTRLTGTYSDATFTGTGQLANGDWVSWKASASAAADTASKKTAKGG